MSIQQKASALFPHTEWTGGSGIHVSHARQGEVGLPFENRALVLHALKKAKYPSSVYRVLQRHFGNMEWLLDQDTFESLMMVDINLRLQGLNTLVTSDRVQNPCTGNYFHKIALLPPLIGSVRFWADKAWDGINLGFRFRIVEQENEQEQATVRQLALKLSEDVIIKATEVDQYMLEFNEPPTETQTEVCLALCEMWEEGADHD